MKRIVIVLAIAFALAIFGHGMQVIAQTGAPAGQWGPGMMGGYGTPWTMGPGMMGGYAMGPGMMGNYGMAPGMMGPGMMGPGMMGPGMMGGYGMGPWMMGPPWNGAQALNLSTEDVTGYFERWLAWQGNPRITLGDVTERDDDTITADIVTREGNVLVQRVLVNRHTGAMWQDQS